MINRIKRKISEILKNLRDFYYNNFNRNYIRISLSKRKGECKMCGACCKGCYLLAREGKCLNYHNRPIWCIIRTDFPIDELDKKLMGIKDCGYYWE